MGYMSGQTETDTKESGDIVSDMAKAMTSLPMETRTWASMFLEKQTDMVSTNGLMATPTRVFSMKA